MNKPNFEQEHIATNVTDRVKLIVNNPSKLSTYIEDALLSLTFDDGFNATPFVEAIKFDDSEAVGRMLTERIYSLIESDCVADLMDEAKHAENICERYERDQGYDDHF